MWLLFVLDNNCQNLFEFTRPGLQPSIGALSLDSALRTSRSFDGPFLRISALLFGQLGASVSDVQA